MSINGSSLIEQPRSIEYESSMVREAIESPCIATESIRLIDVNVSPRITSGSRSNLNDSGNLSLFDLGPRMEASYSENGFKCLFTNPTSLNNKWNEFNALLMFLEYPHVVGVAETWFNANSKTTLANYTLFRKDLDGTSGGGVAIYIRKDLKSFEVMLPGVESEQVWCQIHVGNTKFLIGCVYRPLLCRIEISDNINQCLRSAKSLVDSRVFNSMLVMGDFNHPDIKWSNLG